MSEQNPDDAIADAAPYGDDDYLDDYLDSEIDADLEADPESDAWGALHAPHGEPWGGSRGGGEDAGFRARRRVTHLVLVDGLPADHWVDESETGGWSGRGRHLLGAGSGSATMREPPHLHELRWLESLVGGRTALMSLDTAGLVTPSTVSLPPTLGDPAQATRAGAVRAVCARHAAALFHDAEMPAATHYALEAVLRADPAFLVRSSRDDTAAGAVLWIAGHANGAIGPSGDLSARDLWERTGLSSSAASRGATLLHRLRSARGAYAGSRLLDDTPPAGAPRLKATGHPSLLTSATRTLIAARRDAALAAASS